MERIGLVEAISTIREELAAAINASAGEELRFEVGEVTVEFEIAFESSGELKGGVKAWVLEFGGARTNTDRNTHRISVPLRPVLPGGRPVLTGESEIPD